MFKEFRDLRRKPETEQGLADLLNYAFAEDDQTIIMKDGARLAAFECLGPDLNSAGNRGARRPSRSCEPGAHPTRRELRIPGRFHSLSQRGVSRASIRRPCQFH